MARFHNLKDRNNPSGRQNLSNKFGPNPSEFDRVSFVFWINQSIYENCKDSCFTGKPFEITFKQEINIHLVKQTYYIVFEKLKLETVTLTKNTHFDVKLKSRVKSDASHKGLGATRTTARESLGSGFLR